jgi:hypothetical protein
MARTKNNPKPPATPPSADAEEQSGDAAPSATRGLVQVVTKFWQLASALVGLVTIVVAGLTYFATREQLMEIECLQKNNLIASTSTTAIAQYKLQIALAQKEAAVLTQGTAERMYKDTEIADLTKAKDAAMAAYEQAYKQLQQGTCFDKSARNPPEKKP